MAETDQWTIELKRDADFWEDQVTVKDEAGALVEFTDSELVIHPNEGTGETIYDDEVWNLTNGKLIIVSPGVFGFEVPMEEIAAFPWSAGRFCWSVTYTDGHRDKSWMTGKVKIIKACL
jgi:hypothetical protein